MERRTFLQWMMAGAVTAGWQAAAAPVLQLNQLASQTGAATPWSVGFAGATADFAPLPLKTSGVWPADLHGNFYRNGPAMMQRGSERYQHWFDGDGMVQQFRIGAGRVEHQGKFVQTKKFRTEQQQGMFRYHGAGTLVKNPLAVRNNDDLNTANTALLPWQGELLALWEAGSPHRLDPDSLSTLGVQDFGEEFKQLPFSAHPLPDGLGGVWNFGTWYYGGQKTLLLYQVAAKGISRLQQITLPQASYVHAFAQSQGKLVFYLSACVYEQGRTPIEAYKWRPQLGSQLLIVDKNDFSQQQWVELPAGFVFHLGQAWQQQRQLYLQLSLYPDASLMLNGMKQLLAGNRHKTSSQAQLVTLQVALGQKNAQATLHQSGVALEFPQFAANDKPGTLYGIGASSMAESAMSDTLYAVTPNGSHQQFRFGSGVILEEPLHIPRAAGGGYLLCSLLDYQQHKSGLALFDSQDIRRGPVALATMDRVLPLGFHGCFMPA